MRYFEIFPFVYKYDRKQILVKIGRNRIQSLDNFISNLTSFSHQYNESAIISVNFDLYNGNFSEKLLNIEGQKTFLRKLIATNCFCKSNGSLAVDELTNNNSFILRVVSKNMSLLPDEFKSFVADFEFIDIKIDESKALEEQLDKIRFKSNNNIFYLLSFKNQPEYLYAKTQIRLIKQLIALKESIPAFVIIQFDEYYDSANALYSMLLFK